MTTTRAYRLRQIGQHYTTAFACGRLCGRCNCIGLRLVFALFLIGLGNNSCFPGCTAFTTYEHCNAPNSPRRLLQLSFYINNSENTRMLGSTGTVAQRRFKLATTVRGILVASAASSDPIHNIHCKGITYRTQSASRIPTLFVAPTPSSQRQRVLPFKSTLLACHRLPETRANTHTKLFSSITSIKGGAMDDMPPNNGSRPIDNGGDDTKEQHTSYEEWVRRLYMTNLFHPVKMGLTNMQRIHQLLGNPMDDPKVAIIHVAGTNGKGSVALKIANTLQQYGLRVGLFCSPHVSSFRERMQVNGLLIEEEEVVELLPPIYDLCEKHDIPATFFEITTALAFSFYAHQRAQVVVLETGLGGRLDATNVIASPALSIITSIGLEHTRILGDTIEKIALEKGGIIKPNCPVLVGPHCPQDVLRQCAQDKGSGPYYVPSDVLGAANSETQDYDKENQQIAKAALILLKSTHPGLFDPSSPMTEEAIDRGILIRPPCRFEQIQDYSVGGDGDDDNGLTVVLDVAHNPPAMEYLVRKLKSTYPNSKFRFVVGMSSDKDLGQCGRSIMQVVNPDAIHLVEAAHPRAAKLEAIRDAEPRLLDCHCDLEDRSITRQIFKAKALASENGEILVVCGSVFLMAEAREALGFDEPRDSPYVAEVAGSGFRHGQEVFGNTKV